MASVYAVIATLEGRTAPTLATCFEGADNVIGVRTLEDLGLRVDPVSGKLEPVRPSNLAYFYGETDLRF
jgi:predicted aspartyl protease